MASIKHGEQVVNMTMDDALLFEDREAFRQWLAGNEDQQGVWLLFGKKGGPKTLTAVQALEEALCFGWIDGQMESLDEKRYRKYFAPRRSNSKWSPKNRELAEQLEAQGRMTDRGRMKIEEAKGHGCWEGQQRLKPTPEQIEALKVRLSPYGQAYRNFVNMSPSVQRTYTCFCLDVKTDEAAQRRFVQLVQRLELNLDPMASLKQKQGGNG